MSGNNSVPPPKNGKQSSKLVLGTGEVVESAPLIIGSSSIDDVIEMHLLECVQCREATQHRKPIALGQKSGHCDTYWQLQLMRAQYEGEVNNIVHHTEYGDEAPKRGRLE